MTQEQLDIILSLSIEGQLEAFQKSSFIIPKWADLDKQYDPLKHSILTDTSKYPPKLNPDTGVDEIKRTPFSLQKLAVDRITQAMFSTPVKRDFDYDDQSEGQKNAISIFEQVYRTDNSIDGSNIERGKKLNSSCQIVTIWNIIQKPSKVKGIESKFTLTHSTYSPKDGYDIYAQTDENEKILTIGIGYEDIENKEHFIVYISGLKPKVLKYEKADEGWIINKEASTDLPFFPCIYSYLDNPVWGGLSGTNKVEQLEEMEAYQGFYVFKNQAPLFTMDMGDTSGMLKSDTKENINDSKKIVEVGKGGNISPLQWVGAGPQLTDRIARIRNAYFEEIQIPDNSFANLIKSNTSAENKEIIFSDSKNKAIDLGGEWEKFLLQEFKVVREFIKIMFPTTATDLDLISVRSVIKPYNIRTKKDNAEYISIGGEGMSLQTKVRVLDEVSNIEQEVEAIENERGAAANQGF